MQTVIYGNLAMGQQVLILILHIPIYHREPIMSALHLKDNVEHQRLTKL